MILVAYVTKYGSTGEVAQAMAEAIRATGVAVDFKPMAAVESLEAYDGVILGVALYMTRFSRGARRFLANHRKALSSKRVSLFALGPVQNEAKDWDAARHQLTKELAKFPWFAPVSAEIFGGRWDPAKLGFPFNFMPPLRNMPKQDVRDWEAIRSWAREQSAVLEPVSS